MHVWRIESCIYATSADHETDLACPSASAIIETHANAP